MTWPSARADEFCFALKTSINLAASRNTKALSLKTSPGGPLYPGLCRNLTGAERKARVVSGAAYALRLDAVKAAARVGPLAFEEHGN